MIGRTANVSPSGTPSRWYAGSVVAIATLFIGLAWIGITSSANPVNISNTQAADDAATPLSSSKIQLAFAVAVAAGIGTLFPSRAIGRKTTEEEPVVAIADRTGHPVLASIFEQSKRIKKTGTRWGSIFTATIFASEVVVAVGVMLSIAVAFSSPDVADLLMRSPLEGFVEMIRQTLSYSKELPADNVA